MLMLNQGIRLRTPPPPGLYGSGFRFCPLWSWRGAGASPTVFDSGHKRHASIAADTGAAEVDDIVAIWMLGRLFTRPTGQPRHAISETLG